FLHFHFEICCCHCHIVRLFFSICWSSSSLLN
ncbi:3-oxoadipate CoA-transferase, partial [Acinetobacter baumannii]